MKRKDGRTSDVPEEVKEGYRSFFADLYADGTAGEPLRSTRPLQVSTRWDGLMAPPTEKEVLAALRHMRRRTAAGPDLLFAPMIKWAAIPVQREEKGLVVAPSMSGETSGVQAISLLWARCLAERRMPTAWRESYLTLIPKDEGGVAGDPARTRPIAVSSVLYRGLMWIVMKRVLRMGDGRIPWSQRGFRSGGQCADVVEMVDAAIHSAQAFGTGLVLTQVDLTKAYDSMRHQAMLDDLASKHAMPGEFIEFLGDALTRLSARVWTAYGLSDTLPIRRGIRQGCPLSPVLFALLVSSRIEAAARRVDLTGLRLFGSGNYVPHHLEYADDIVLLTATGREAGRLGNAIADELCTLGLGISAQKSTYRTFAAKDDQVVIGGAPVPRRTGQATRLLGYWLEEDGWHTHQAVVDGAVKRVIARLSRLGLAGTNKLRIYNWIAAGIVRYSAPLADIDGVAGKLDRAATRAAKRWLGFHPTVSSEALRTPVQKGGFGLVSLRDEARMQRAIYLMRRLGQQHAQHRSRRRSRASLLFDDYVHLVHAQGVPGWPYVQCCRGLTRSAGRELWLFRAIRTWSALKVEPVPPRGSDEAGTDWVDRLPRVKHPGQGAEIVLWTDGSAEGGRAAWAVAGLEAGFSVNGRAWGAQTSYRGELCAIDMALRLAPPDVPLTIRSDSRAAIMAIDAGLRGNRPRWDAPSKALVDGIVARGLRRSARWGIKWVKAHIGVAGNELADRLAKAGLAKQEVEPPAADRQAAGGRDVPRFRVGDVVADSDYRDILQEAMWQTRAAGLPERSREWWRATGKDWRAGRVPAEAARFVFKARGHALPTARRARLYFPQADVPLQCGLCGESDDATHWYQCAALEAAWRQELGKKIGDQGRRQLGDEWLRATWRERAAWGLRPVSLRGVDKAEVASLAAAAMAVWQRREALWRARSEKGKAGPTPRQLMLAAHRGTASG